MESECLNQIRRHKNVVYDHFPVILFPIGSKKNWLDLLWLDSKKKTLKVVEVYVSTMVNNNGEVEVFERNNKWRW